ncbi:MAG: sodium:proton antiporter [Opitutae bacterium]|nr:sodium:proton antiporter [Opitutae bacterium]MCD8299233.1 sodium:proton antiporter [Opitutae bacterium]
MCNFLASSLGAAEVRLWMAIPFVFLLILIAVMPLTPHRLKEFWEKYYPHVAIFLGVVVAAFYAWWIPGGGEAVWHSFKEYVSFIALVGSLFVISGGIVINLKGEATPKTNIIFLFVGAVLANLIGTTGASMVLIRPWMRMNKCRLSAYHIVFFIFIVSNIGGALTPIGDPPLYIGYLRGVPFFWILEHALLPWVFVIAVLLAVFWIFDSRKFFHHGGAPKPAHPEQEDTEILFSLRGIKNIGYLIVVVVAVFLPGQVSAETRAVLETYFVREIVMVAAACASYLTTKQKTHEENEFSFAPIKEVAFLFVGIFLTMVPALAYLSAHAKEIGETLSQAAHYFFASGLLSGFLDNTPTYANFFDLIRSQVDAPDDVARVAKMLESTNAKEHALLVAVSLGSVFFGALTYIGNGPNFMVKSIADSSGVKMPSFFGYMGRFSLPILLPTLILCSVFFMPNFNPPQQTEESEELSPPQNDGAAPEIFAPEETQAVAEAA